MVSVPERHTERGEHAGEAAILNADARELSRRFAPAAWFKKDWLNGIPHTKPYIDYDDIIRGGELVFEMTADSSIAPS